MKVHGPHPQHVHPAAMRPAAKVRNEAMEPVATTAPVAPEPTAASTAMSGDAAAPVATESTLALAARKKLPPGLLRVAARLEAMGAEGRTGGQSNALAQITRNLQRYADLQGLTVPTAPAPQAPTDSTPEVDAAIPETPTDPTTPPPVTTTEALLIDALLDTPAAPAEPAEPDAL